MVIWRCRDRTFECSARPLVMGIVNVTPDSFSDGGRYADAGDATARARKLADEGADLIDLGAESTRPGSSPVDAEEQIRRLRPVLDTLAAEGALALSIDTSNADVAAWALEAGAHVVNDVTGLGDPRMAATLGASDAGVVLMHMLGTPATMQDDPRYDDVARDVAGFLRERVGRAVAAGIGAERIAVDPGIGFGKTAEHNFELIARLEELSVLGRPVLVGASRKRFLGPGVPPEQRLAGGLAAAAVAVFLGAAIVRTHDVAETVRAVRLAGELRAARRGVA